MYNFIFFPSSISFPPRSEFLLVWFWNSEFQCVSSWCLISLILIPICETQVTLYSIAIIFPWQLVQALRFGSKPSGSDSTSVVYTHDPPTQSLRSKITTWCLCRWSSCAVTKPPAPAPITATCAVDMWI
jgi:hypothetical protein